MSIFERFGFLCYEETLEKNLPKSQKKAIDLLFDFFQ